MSWADINLCATCAVNEANVHDAALAALAATPLCRAAGPRQAGGSYAFGCGAAAATKPRSAPPKTALVPGERDAPATERDAASRTVRRTRWRSAGGL